MTTARRSNRRIIIAPYNMRVSAAREIAEGVGGMRIYPEGSRYQPRQSDIIINWGRSRLPEWPAVLNRPENVRCAINKAEAWATLQANNVPTVEWTSHMPLVEEWTRDGGIVLCRQNLRGRGGQGISVINYHLTEWDGDTSPDTYVRYFKKRREFRVHVWGNQMIDLQEKRKRRGADADRYIRSHDNGWIFARQGVTCPAAVSEAGVAAVRALGLQFGAVDIGWNEHYQRPCVFEVNTAPGIEGTTVEKYVQKINEIKELAA